MTKRRYVFLGVCGLAALISLAALQGQDRAAPTTLHVLLPKQDEPQLLIDGKEIEGKGRRRTVAAPPLAKDKKAYEVAACWATNNYTKFYRTRTVLAEPGKEVTVDLRQPDPKRPDHIEIRYVPTPEDVVARMCKLAKVSKDDVVYDLGCGDGRIVITAVDQYGARRGVGIDLDPERIAEAKENGEKQDVLDRVEFRVGDVLKIKDLQSATVVMLYMGDDVNLRLRPILQKTLRPGARIVSHRFGMGDWQPDRTEEFVGEDGDEYTIHLWTIR